MLTHLPTQNVDSMNSSSNRRKRADPMPSHQTFRNEKDKIISDGLCLAYDQTLRFEKIYESSPFSFSKESVTAWNTFDRHYADTAIYVRTTLFRSISTELEKIMVENAGGKFKNRTNQCHIKYHFDRMAALDSRIQNLERLHESSSFPFSVASVHQRAFFDMEFAKVNKIVEQLKKLKTTGATPNKPVLF
ncbi:unnamed protein product [Caenorhabditis nigoni]